MAKAATVISEASAERSFSSLRQVAIVVCASAVIAVCARLVLPLPFTPVPLTLANFGVLLVGLTLGSKRGFAAAAVYLGWGAMGLPVFSPAGPGGVAQLLGPTAGYLWAYPVVAFIAGLIAERGIPSFMRNVTAGMAAEAVLFSCGIAWLTLITHSWLHAAAFGLYPFVAAEVMKVMLAAGLARRLRRTF
jgi:biotin transport system substrate-specific component